MKKIFEILKFFILPFAFVGGLIYYLLSKKTPHLFYYAFRYMFVLTKGKSNDLLAKIIAKFSTPYEIEESNGLLGPLKNSQVDEICSEIDKKGFYIFDKKLTEENLKSILSYSRKTPIKYLKNSEKGFVHSEEKVLFDENNPVSNRYVFDDKNLLINDELSKLAFDENLFHIANNYLKSKPFLDIITLWWSLPFSKELEDRAAQKYHFDMDRIKFLKFFFYITDVNTNNGPHCYVEGSHKSMPSNFYKDKRIDDEEVIKGFSNNLVHEFVGKSGTILAVDTRGLHKGKPLVSGSRLLFQLQFSNSLFGAKHIDYKFHNPTSSQKELKAKYNITYSLIH